VNEKRCRYAVIIPLAIFAVGAILTWVTSLDIRVESYFFDEGTKAWPTGDIMPFRTAYMFGDLVGILPGVLALVVLIAGIWKKDLRRWRMASVFVIVLLIVTPMGIINGVFKDNWGRPRPRQVEEFCGTNKYLPALVIGQRHGGRRSFPCGHASMGYCFMALYFVFNARYRKLALYLFWLGILFGTFIGVARMAQGAHWPSDVIWSFGIVYFSAYALARIMHLDRMECDERQV
jgi:lipid A 4'-phosphatase